MLAALLEVRVGVEAGAGRGEQDNVARTRERVGDANGVRKLVDALDWDAGSEHRAGQQFAGLAETDDGAAALA